MRIFSEALRLLAVVVHAHVPHKVLAAILAIFVQLGRLEVLVRFRKVAPAGHRSGLKRALRATCDEGHTMVLPRLLVNDDIIISEALGAVAGVLAIVATPLGRSTTCCILLLSYPLSCCRTRRVSMAPIPCANAAVSFRCFMDAPSRSQGRGLVGANSAEVRRLQLHERAVEETFRTVRSSGSFKDTHRQDALAMLMSSHRTADELQSWRCSSCCDAMASPEHSRTKTFRRSRCCNVVSCECRLASSSERTPT